MIEKNLYPVQTPGTTPEQAQANGNLLANISIIRDRLDKLIDASNAIDASLNQIENRLDRIEQVYPLD